MKLTPEQRAHLALLVNDLAGAVTVFRAELDREDVDLESFLLPARVAGLTCAAIGGSCEDLLADNWHPEPKSGSSVRHLATGDLPAKALLPIRRDAGLESRATAPRLPYKDPPDD